MQCHIQERLDISRYHFSYISSGFRQCTHDKLFKPSDTSKLEASVQTSVELAADMGSHTRNVIWDRASTPLPCLREMHLISSGFSKPKYTPMPTSPVLAAWRSSSNQRRHTCSQKPDRQRRCQKPPPTKPSDFIHV